MSMTALIDTDILWLLYEVGHKSQMKDKETGEIIPLSWEEAMQKMDDTIAQICADIYATEPPILYITGEGNFRDTIATERPYKGNRKSDKPFHYHNLKAYIKASIAALGTGPDNLTETTKIDPINAAPITIAMAKKTGISFASVKKWINKVISRGLLDLILLPRIGD